MIMILIFYWSQHWIQLFYLFLFLFYRTVLGNQYLNKRSNFWQNSFLNKYKHTLFDMFFTLFFFAYKYYWNKMFCSTAGFLIARLTELTIVKIFNHSENWGLNLPQITTLFFPAELPLKSEILIWKSIMVFLWTPEILKFFILKHHLRNN